MLRLYLLFLAFIINTTLTRVWTIEGTWENLFTSINVHEYNVCISFYYVCFMLENRKHEK